MIEGLKGILEAVIALRGESRLEAADFKFFMPAEIYDSVFKEFPGKMQSSAVFLRWSTPNLITMLARRFLDILIRVKSLPETRLSELEKIVCRAYKHADGQNVKEAFWYRERFLPTTITNRHDNEEDCFAYMLRHTQKRPRDILAQMQAIIDQSRARNEFPFISADAVRAGIHDEAVMSQILSDSLTPYEGQLPLDLVTAARETFYNRPRVMSGRDLLRFAKELYNLHPLQEIEPDSFVQILLRCGVVGMLTNKQSSSSHNTPNSIYQSATFEYVIHSNLPVSERFDYCVHPVLGDVFEMASPPDGTVIHPAPDQNEENLVWRNN